MVRSKTCTFIGLGNMGRELCARIGSAGFPTLAYDVNPEAAKYAEEAGLKVVMDRCPKIEYARLTGELGWNGINTGVISNRRKRL